MLDECEGDVSRAAPRFTEARLPDAEALNAMDLQARRVSGADGLTFLLLATRFHILLGTALRRLLPSRFKGAAYTSMGTSMPYSKVCSIE